MAESDQDALWVVDSGGPKKACIRWGAHKSHLANTTEPSMCGGDAAILSNYFDHLFTWCSMVSWSLKVRCLQNGVNPL